MSVTNESSFSRFRYIVGGSAWESNPPKALQVPPAGFEVREAHRDPTAPVSEMKRVYTADRWAATMALLDKIALTFLIRELTTHGVWMGQSEGNMTSFGYSSDCLSWSAICWHRGGLLRQ